MKRLWAWLVLTYYGYCPTHFKAGYCPDCKVIREHGKIEKAQDKRLTEKIRVGKAKRYLEEQRNGK